MGSTSDAWLFLPLSQTLFEVGSVRIFKLRFIEVDPTAVLRSESCRDVAQPGSALAWGARGREFKSRRPDQSFYKSGSGFRP